VSIGQANQTFTFVLHTTTVTTLTEQTRWMDAVVIRWFDHARETAANELPDGPFRGVPFLLKDLYATYAGPSSARGRRRRGL
jgi:Asp-tRNA(Asn)/Glu-tRNA(Gln) amidotransferase A subunit family amidase